MKAWRAARLRDGELTSWALGGPSLGLPRHTATCRMEAVSRLLPGVPMPNVPPPGPSHWRNCLCGIYAVASPLTMRFVARHEKRAPLAIYGVILDDDWRAAGRVEPPGTMRARTATVTGPLVVWGDGQPEVGAALTSAVKGDVRYVDPTPDALDRALARLDAASSQSERMRQWQLVAERTR